MSRLKSAVMWAGVIATAAMGFIAANGTSAIGGSPAVDSVVIWLCGLISVISHLNNPTDKNNF